MFSTVLSKNGGFWSDHASAANGSFAPKLTDAASRTDVSIARDAVFAFQRATSNHFTQPPFLG